MKEKTWPVESFPINQPNFFIVPEERICVWYFVLFYGHLPTCTVKKIRGSPHENQFIHFPSKTLIVNPRETCMHTRAFRAGMRGKYLCVWAYRSHSPCTLRSSFHSQHTQLCGVDFSSYFCSPTEHRTAIQAKRCVKTGPKPPTVTSKEVRVSVCVCVSGTIKLNFFYFGTNIDH